MTLSDHWQVTLIGTTEFYSMSPDSYLWVRDETKNFVARLFITYVLS